MDDCTVTHAELGPCRRTRWHAFHVFGFWPDAVIVRNEDWESLPKKLSPKKIKAMADEILSEREE